MVAPVSESSISTTDFDTDEEDFGENEDLSPLQIDWLDLSLIGCHSHSELIGISALPGCKFMHINRNLHDDIECLVHKGIQDVFILCTQGEMIRCRVPEILENYVNAGITPHHYPMDDFKEPKFKTCLETVQKLLECIKEERKTLIHCIAGVGRTCLVAGLLLLELDSNMQEDAVIQKLQDLRGPNAIQTVKQFNFINDFRESKNKFSMQPIIEAPLSIRSVSR